MGDPHPAPSRGPSRWRTLLSPKPSCLTHCPSPPHALVSVTKSPPGAARPPGTDGSSAERPSCDPRGVTVKGDAAKGRVCSGYKNQVPSPSFPHLCHPLFLLSSAPPPHQCPGEQPGWSHYVLPHGPAVVWEYECVCGWSCGEEMALVEWL